jgi:hypothetical protein
MFIRKRLTYANVVATLALLFAMSGGALAASKYLITSTKQISPKVVKQLKGNAGPAGNTGPSGPAGKEGQTGKTGEPGKEGKAGAPGATSVITRYGPETGVAAAGEGSSYASCEGQSVTGGGYDYASTTSVIVIADRPSSVFTLFILGKFIITYPAPTENTAATGWLTSIKNTGGSEVKIRSYVICAAP